MLQESASGQDRAPAAGLWTAQSVRILGFVLGLDLLLQRGLSQGVIALRLRVELTWLDAVSEFAQGVGPYLRTALLLASVLVSLTVTAGVVARGSWVVRITTFGSGLVALWCLAWRLAPETLPRPLPGVMTPLLLLGAWTVTTAPRPRARTLPLLVTTLGTALCTAWFLLVSGAASAGTLARVAEMSGELLLLLGPALALPLALRTPPPPGRLPAIVAAAALALVLVAWWSAPEAFLHLVRHVLMVRQAGLPGWLIAILVATALASLAGLLLRRAGWQQEALVLLVLLAGARSPDPELLALRAAAVTLLIRLAATPARQP